MIIYTIIMKLLNIHFLNEYDIIIYAKDLKDHSQKLAEIFTRLRQYNLKLQPLKCKFLRKEFTYLGHRITDEGT